MLDLVAKNEEMLANKAYKVKDERMMLKISSLSTELNDFDLYLIACCLCNYPIEEKSEAMELRMKYFKATNNGQRDGFEHPAADYRKVFSSVKCKNTGNINKYGLYEYEISVNDKDLVSDLWLFKKINDSLKYVDSKTFDDKLIVSISRDQFSNFTRMLDALLISYDEDDLREGLFYQNKSGRELVDLNTLSLPFEPYPYQIEDAKKIVNRKRMLLGHEMGCISGDAIVTVKILDSVVNMTLADLYSKNPSTNIEIKAYANNQFVFLPIKAVLNKGKKPVIKIVTSNRSLKCTADHEILTTSGWVEASKLNIGYTIISSNNETERVVYIEYLTEEEYVYDIALDSFIVSNFVANDLVVHNCGKTFISILVGTSIGESNDVVYSTADNLDYGDIVITDKGPLPIGKIVEENIDCKVQVTKNGKTEFVNILDRSYVEA